MLLVSKESKKGCALGCRRYTCSAIQPAEWPLQTVAEGVGNVWRHTWAISFPYGPKNLIPSHPAVLHVEFMYAVLTVHRNCVWSMDRVLVFPCVNNSIQWLNFSLINWIPWIPLRSYITRLFLRAYVLIMLCTLLYPLTRLPYPSRKIAMKNGDSILVMLLRLIYILSKSLPHFFLLLLPKI